jgi:hypothetical protein
VSGRTIVPADIQVMEDGLAGIWDRPLLTARTVVAQNFEDWWKR